MSLTSSQGLWVHRQFENRRNAGTMESVVELSELAYPTVRRPSQPDLTVEFASRESLDKGAKAV
jgi:hypothetical protein